MSIREHSRGASPFFADLGGGGAGGGGGVATLIGSSMEALDVAMDRTTFSSTVSLKWCSRIKVNGGAGRAEAASSTALYRAWREFEEPAGGGDCSVRGVGSGRVAPGRQPHGLKC